LVLYKLIKKLTYIKNKELTRKKTWSLAVVVLHRINLLVLPENRLIKWAGVGRWWWQLYSKFP